MVILTPNRNLITFSFSFFLLLAISLLNLLLLDPVFSIENYSSKEKRTDLESWNTFDNDYPHSILISNFTHSVNPKSIYEIKSGDSDHVLNPNFVLPKEPVLDIGLTNVISFGVNYSHIEGAGSKIEVGDNTGNTMEIPILT